MYHCDICNYSTDYSSNFYIHKKSKKHIKLCAKKDLYECNLEDNNNINVSNVSANVSFVSANVSPNVSFVSANTANNIIEKLICNNCKEKFKHRSSLSRHKKNCSIINDNNTKNETVNELKIKLELIKKENELEKREKDFKLALIEKENELYKKLEKEKSDMLSNFMNNANILLNKTTDNNKITTQAMQNVSMSALKYANDKFKDTPVLIPIENFNINELSFENAEEKGQLTEILIYNAKQNSIDKLLGDHIIKYYKKENPENQSFHSTDCSRLNYIVRELIENTPTWIVDKNGIKICKDIMKPLIKKCINALLDYQKELLHQMGNGNYNKQKEVELIIDIIMSIDSGNLENDINKYIAPFFNLNKA